MTTTKALAADLSKKIIELNQQKTDLIEKGPKPNLREEYEQLNNQIAQAINQASAAGLTLISVLVAHENVLYYESGRTETGLTFEWLNTGGDRYSPNFGPVVTLPLSTAEELINQFNSSNLVLF